MDQLYDSDFIIRNKDKVLESLYPQYHIPEVKLLVKRITNSISFGVDFIDQFDPEEEDSCIKYFLNLSVNQGDMSFEIEHNNYIYGAYGYIDIWNEFINELKSPVINICSIRLHDESKTTFFYYKDDNLFLIEQGDVTLCLFNNVDIELLYASSILFTKVMKKRFDKFVLKHGFNEELRGSFNYS